MGYRSHVIVLIYPDVGDVEREQPLYDQLKVLMGTTFANISADWFADCMTWNDAARVLKFDMTEVKWYPDYPEVQLFEAMLAELGSGEIEGYCTEFFRVGEDHEDVVTRRTGENNAYHLSISTNITCEV